jgi:D-alanine-D-alanine ligase
MNITVLLGGTSAERDVSIASGSRVAAALRQRGHQVSIVDPASGAIDEDALGRALPQGVRREWPTKERLAALQANALGPRLGTLPEIMHADVVFNALHGGDGENGIIQAILDSAGVVYTGSGPIGSALAMDKDLAKILFRAAGVKTADWVMAPAPVEKISSLGLPVIVKPSKQGSTVGLSLVKRPDDVGRAVDDAFEHDDEVMIEQFIAGRELTVGVLGDIALPVGEIFPKNELYDYEAKYTSGMAREVFPADLTREETAAIQAAAIAAFRALKLRGFARIDFRMSQDGTFYCLEANTNPGLTELSLIPQAAAAAGMSFGEFCERVVELAVSGHALERDARR